MCTYVLKSLRRETKIYYINEVGKFKKLQGKSVRWQLYAFKQWKIFRSNTEEIWK